MLSMNFLTYLEMNLSNSTLELLQTLLKVVVFSILWKQILLMKSLRLTSERLRLEQLLQADMTLEHMDLFHLSRTKEHVDPVWPSPAWPQLKLVSARLLESLEIIQNSKWLTVDIRRMEPMVAMVLHLMPTSSTGETTN